MYFQIVYKEADSRTMIDQQHLLLSDLNLNDSATDSTDNNKTTTTATSTKPSLQSNSPSRCKHSFLSF